MKGGPSYHRVRPTVLLVGEGYAECAFLKHLKGLYLQRSSSVAVTIKNAYGKGARHVVDVAIRQSRNAQFDTVAALLDTDTGWNEKTASLANRAKVIVIQATPCLEALLLRAHKKPVEGKTVEQLKRDFFTHFGGQAHDEMVYDKHFALAFMDGVIEDIAPFSQIKSLLRPAQS